MKLSSSSWNKYIKRLSAINEKAGKLMQDYIRVNGTTDTQKLVDYAFMLVTKYGEASAELACLMYDEIATLQGARVLPATPAPTATYAETAIAVNGSKLQGDAIIPNAVNRLVKMAGQDTTLQNARRDGAEWAWVPVGDTCAFCITLASRGWQRQSRRAMQGGHAQHIHANCDCAYTVRFNGQPELEGYDPDKYLEMYNSHSGSPQNKINAMRRENYAKIKGERNLRRRQLYAQEKTEQKNQTTS